jgi:hypothetical protein
LLVLIGVLRNTKEDEFPALVPPSVDGRHIAGGSLNVVRRRDCDLWPVVEKGYYERAYRHRIARHTLPPATTGLPSARTIRLLFL